MQLAFEPFDFPDFPTLVNKAIGWEHKHRGVVESRKRNWAARKPAGGSSSQQHVWHPATVRPSAPALARYPASPQARPQPPAPRVPQPPPCPAAQQATDFRPVDCYNCGEYGHYSNRCPKKVPGPVQFAPPHAPAGPAARGRGRGAPPARNPAPRSA
ncbi:hypothetical protein E2562_017488 [Oryza meyeriana var. granulata]|uniref:CCHC-type domain-containing protein n=1 Tax=Oryza meyeriana var. granulata TaxID=110450 RepID=A0A6G1DYL0_9ORYZ|nr:hypothetical protein E2562_017488 [Oryza meyeriana var. granulata]